MKTTTQDVLAQVKTAFGFVPNLMAEIAEGNPAVASAYLAASAALRGALSATETQIVMLAASAFNECHYCTSAHRTAAKSMGIAQSELEAIDDLQLPADPRLASLVHATWSLQRERGWVAPADLALSRAELYEIVALIGLKTITNFINHLAATPIDQPFQAQAKRTIPVAA